MKNEPTNPIDLILNRAAEETKYAKIVAARSLKDKEIAAIDALTAYIKAGPLAELIMVESPDTWLLNVNLREQVWPIGKGYLSSSVGGIRNLEFDITTGQKGEVVIECKSDKQFGIDPARVIAARGGWNDEKRAEKRKELSRKSQKRKTLFHKLYDAETAEEAEAIAEEIKAAGGDPAKSLESWRFRREWEDDHHRQAMKYKAEFETYVIDYVATHKANVILADARQPEPYDSWKLTYHTSPDGQGTASDIVLSPTADEKGWYQHLNYEGMVTPKKYGFVVSVEIADSQMRESYAGVPYADVRISHYPWEEPDLSGLNTIQVPRPEKGADLSHEQAQAIETLAWEKLDPSIQIPF